jgi:glyoxylase-like metal-dependent hydrolase (beta-lactamase superfamily II)
MVRAWVSLIVFVALTGCAAPTPEQSIIDDAADALGGKTRLQAVRSLTIEGEGTNFNLGQDMVPGASNQTFTLTGYRRLLDIGGGRMRVEQTRTPNFAYFQGPAPQQQIQAVDGDTGFNVNASGAATRIAAAASQDRKRDFYHHPLTIVRAALDPAAKLSNPQTSGSDRSVDITTANGLVATLTIDGTTALPKAVSSKSYHANLGDVVITTTFADYQDVNGLKLPSKLTSKIDDFTTAEIRAGKQSIDADVGDLAVPASATAAPAPPTINVTVEPVGTGVWFLAGQSHHSVLVEFSDHLTLIEAPQSEARTLAVIAKARELRPGKPLTELVMTHHHFDHTGGLRAAISEGLAVTTHTGNKDFVETMAKRAHTIQSDALAKSPKQVTVRTVSDEMELKDASMTVMLYHVAGNPHSDTMLMAYVPKDRILVEADAFSPGAQVNPYAANLLENVTKRKLRVDRIVPLHGTIVPMSELTKVVGS